MALQKFPQLKEIAVDVPNVEPDTIQHIGKILQQYP